MVILDTNIIIDHLRTESSLKSLLEKFINESSLENMAISILTVQELYAGQSSKNAEKETKILLTISSLQILPYTYEVARLAGEIERDSTSPIEFEDAAIASTAITNGATLYTKNIKHYQKIKNLELYK